LFDVKMEAAKAKADIKEAKRLQKLALRKPGRKGVVEEEDDEEEDEAEEDEDAEDAPVIKHVLTLQGDALLGECRGSLLAFVARQVTSQTDDVSNANTNNYDVYTLPWDACGAVIGDALSNLGDWLAQAKEHVGIDPHAPIVPAYSSPYTSVEGATNWKKLLAPEPEPEADKKKGGKPKPAAGGAKKGGKVDKNAPLSAEQIAEFYGKAHEIVKKELLDMVERVFDVVDSHLEAQARAKLTQPETVPAAAPRAIPRYTNNLHEVGCLSFPATMTALTHFTSKVVLQTFDGYSFVQQTYVNTVHGKCMSAFPVVRQAQQRALEPTLAAAQSGALAVVLLYESNTRNVSTNPCQLEYFHFSDRVMLCRVSL
jgi:hypothetical protein